MRIDRYVKKDTTGTREPAAEDIIGSKSKQEREPESLLAIIIEPLLIQSAVIQSNPLDWVSGVFRFVNK